MKENKNILMLGSDLSVKGGIVSVIKNYVEYSNWDNYNLKFIPTHKEGNKIYKILYFIIALIKILFYVTKNDYHIIHIHVSERGSIKRKRIIINVVKKISPSSKIVLHHHGAEFDKYYDNLSQSKKNAINNMLKKVDVNIVLSNRLISMITSKEPNAKVEVLYNAVNTYEKNNYNKDGKEILFLGRLGTRKGTYDFLEVVKELKPLLIKNGISINLCGDGEIDKIKEYVKKNNLTKVIKHIGWINSEEKKEIFFQTMLNVLPSYNEGLPMTILETMAYGIPNISTDIASIPEVITDNANGFLIKPGDKKKLKELITKLINDGNLREKVSNESYKRINSNFSLQRHIEKLKSIYIRLIDGEKDEN